MTRTHALVSAEAEGAPLSAAPTGDQVDERLAERAVKGEPEAIQRVLAQLAPELRRVCRGVFGSNQADVEDSLQECLFSVVLALPSFRFESNLRHYALRIALRSAVRSRRRMRERSVKAESLALLALAENEGCSPSDASLVSARREALRALLDQLPEEQAEALTLIVVLGYSLEEVAALTGVGANTVKTRARLGKERLRQRIARSPALKSLLGEPP